MIAGKMRKALDGWEKEKWVPNGKRTIDPQEGSNTESVYRHDYRVRLYTFLRWS